MTHQTHSLYFTTGAAAVPAPAVTTSAPVERVLWIFEVTMIISESPLSELSSYASQHVSYLSIESGLKYILNKFPSLFEISKYSF